MRCVGFASPPPRVDRLRLLCESYGEIAPEEVLARSAELYDRDRDRTAVFGAKGMEPWIFLRQGALDLIDENEAWLREHVSVLAAGTRGSKTQA